MLNDKNEKGRNWYMKLVSKFFSDTAIISIENLPQSKFGMLFPSFVLHLYFKMMCFSIENNGIIKIVSYQCDNNNISYIIANMFGFPNNQPLVEQALKILIDMKLIEIYFDEVDASTTVFLPVVSDNTGSVKLTSEERQQRRLAAKQKELASPKETKANKRKTQYGYRKNIFLFKEEYEELSKYPNLKKTLGEYSLEKIYKKAMGEKVDDDSDFDELLKRLQV